MKVRRSTLRDRVTVQTRTAEGSYGDELAEAISVDCLVDETRRLVRSSAGGEIVSESTLTLHPLSRATSLAGTRFKVDPLEVFTPESDVKINGREARVISAKMLRFRGSDYAVEVTCS